jgi:hypothetical protein
MAEVPRDELHSNGDVSKWVYSLGECSYRSGRNYLDDAILRLQRQSVSVVGVCGPASDSAASDSAAVGASSSIWLRTDGIHTWLETWKMDHSIQNSHSVLLHTCNDHMYVIESKISPCFTSTSSVSDSDCDSDSDCHWCLVSILSVWDGQKSQHQTECDSGAGIIRSHVSIYLVQLNNSTGRAEQVRLVHQLSDAQQIWNGIEWLSSIIHNSAHCPVWVACAYTATNARLLTIPTPNQHTDGSEMKLRAVDIQLESSQQRRIRRCVWHSNMSEAHGLQLAVCQQGHLDIVTWPLDDVEATPTRRAFLHGGTLAHLFPLSGASTWLAVTEQAIQFVDPNESAPRDSFATPNRHEPISFSAVDREPLAVELDELKITMPNETIGRGRIHVIESADSHDSTAAAAESISLIASKPTGILGSLMNITEEHSNSGATAAVSAVHSMMDNSGLSQTLPSAAGPGYTAPCSEAFCFRIGNSAVETLWHVPLPAIPDITQCAYSDGVLVIASSSAQKLCGWRVSMLSAPSAEPAWVCEMDDDANRFRGLTLRDRYVTLICGKRPQTTRFFTSLFAKHECELRTFEVCNDLIAGAGAGPTHTSSTPTIVHDQHSVPLLQLIDMMNARFNQLETLIVQSTSALSNRLDSVERIVRTIKK